MLEASCKYLTVLTPCSYLNLRVQKAYLDSLLSQTWLVTLWASLYGNLTVQLHSRCLICRNDKFPTKDSSNPLPGRYKPSLRVLSQTWKGGCPVTHHSVGGSFCHPSGFRSAFQTSVTCVNGRPMQLPNCRKSKQTCNSLGVYLLRLLYNRSRPTFVRILNSWACLGFYVTNMLDPWLLLFNLCLCFFVRVFYQISFHSSLCLTTFLVCFYRFILLFF